MSEEPSLFSELERRNVYKVAVASWNIGFVVPATPEISRRKLAAIMFTDMLRESFAGTLNPNPQVLKNI